MYQDVQRVFKLLQQLGLCRYQVGGPRRSVPAFSVKDPKVGEARVYVCDGIAVFMTRSSIPGVYGSKDRTKTRQVSWIGCD